MKRPDYVQSGSKGQSIDRTCICTVSDQDKTPALLYNVISMTTQTDEIS